MKHLLIIGCGLLVGARCATAQEQTNNISPRAESVLHSACEFLAHTHAFSLNAEVWREHVDESGQKIQFSRTVDMDVKRPDGLRLEITSPLAPPKSRPCTCKYQRSGTPIAAPMIRLATAKPAASARIKTIT